MNNAINEEKIYTKKRGQKKLCIERQQFYLSETNNGDSISKDNKGLIKSQNMGCDSLYVTKKDTWGHVGTRGELHHFSLIPQQPQTEE